MKQSDCTNNYNILAGCIIKEAGRSADLRISKSALLSLNHHSFSNDILNRTQLNRLTKKSFVESLLHYLASES